MTGTSRSSGDNPLRLRQVLGGVICGALGSWVFFHVRDGLRVKTPSPVAAESPTGPRQPVLALQAPASPDAASAPSADPQSDLERCEARLAMVDRFVEAREDARVGRPNAIPAGMQQAFNSDAVKAMLQRRIDQCVDPPIPIGRIDCQEYPCLAVVGTADATVLDQLTSCDDGTRYYLAWGQPIYITNQQGHHDQFVLDVHDRDRFNLADGDEGISAEAQRTTYRTQTLVEDIVQDLVDKHP